MRSPVPLAFVPALLFALGSVASADDAEWVALFNGTNLDGWHQVQEWGKAWVEDGEIRLEGDKKFFLATDKTYGDFVLEGEVNVPVGGNSGFQFRSHYEGNKLWGYQAEVDTSDRKWAGGLYDEGRRAWLNPLKDDPEAQAAFRNGEWNKYRVECRGDRIRIWVNDVLTTDYVDSMDVAGYVAVQHHGEKGKTYRFRNIRIQDLGHREWRPLWDGKTLDGWHALPGGEWAVEDGAIVGRSAASEGRHGQLVSDETFGDFTVRLKFKSVKGNSGLYFRVEPSGDGVGVHGFQAEIDPQNDVGGLYETGGRGWVVQPSAEDVKKWLKPGEWNEMTVSAHGRRVVVHVNGHKTAELKDDPGRTEGHLALQLHGGQEMLVMFKDIERLSEPVE